MLIRLRFLPLEVPDPPPRYRYLNAFDNRQTSKFLKGVIKKGKQLEKQATKAKSEKERKKKINLFITTLSLLSLARWWHMQSLSTPSGGPSRVSSTVLSRGMGWATLKQLSNPPPWRGEETLPLFLLLFFYHFFLNTPHTAHEKAHFPDCADWVAATIQGMP